MNGKHETAIALHAAQENIKKVLATLKLAVDDRRAAKDARNAAICEIARNSNTTNKEIGKIFGLTEGAVRSIIKKTCKKTAPHRRR